MIGGCAISYLLISSLIRNSNFSEADNSRFWSSSFFKSRTSTFSFTGSVPDSSLLLPSCSECLWLRI